MIDPETLDDDSTAYQNVLDLWALDEHVKMLKRELPRLIEEERKRIWAEAKSGDEQAEEYAEITEQALDQGSTTRILTGTALIAIWSTFESVVTRCADRIREVRKLSLRLGDIKGSFLEQAKKYFEGVLGLTLFTDETTAGRLDILRVIRNALGHANGQLDDVTENKRTQIRKWMKEFQGLKEYDGSIVVSIEFVERAFDLVEKVLNDLTTRTEAARRRSGT